MEKGAGHVVRNLSTDRENAMTDLQALNIANQSCTLSLIIQPLSRIRIQT
jgi:hypothetical protein